MKEGAVHKADPHAALRRVLSSDNQREKARAAQSILASLSSGKQPRQRIPLDLMVRNQMGPPGQLVLTLSRLNRCNCCIRPGKSMAQYVSHQTWGFGALLSSLTNEAPRTAQDYRPDAANLTS